MTSQTLHLQWQWTENDIKHTKCSTFDQYDLDIKYSLSAPWWERDIRGHVELSGSRHSRLGDAAPYFHLSGLFGVALATML